MPKRVTTLGRGARVVGRPRVSGLAIVSSRAAISDYLKVALGYGTCIGWWREGWGFTLGGTLLASGTAPPVVTITGTTGPPIGLHLEIDSVAGGTGLGQATFKVSIDNGASYILTGQLTGASVAIGVGIVAAFAAGPYNIDNKWDGTLSGWADQVSTKHLLQGTAAKQALCVPNGVNARSVVRMDGVDDFMAAAFAGVNQPWHIFILFKTRTLGAPYPGHSVVFGSQAAGTTFCLDDTTPRTILTTDSGGNLFGPSSAIANGSFANMNIVANGASSKMRSLSAQVATGNAGALALTGLTLAAFFDGTGTDAIDVAECILYSAEQSTGPLRRFEAADKAEFCL